MDTGSCLEYGGVLLISDKPVPIDEMWFVVKNIPIEKSKPDIDIDVIHTYAKVWSSCKNYSCGYNSQIMDKVHELVKQVYVTKLS